jgi:hypothetical protein
MYWDCNTSTCSERTQTEKIQVQNPVPLFLGDNNGVIVQLPSIAAGGSATTSGSLIFGIGTKSNNVLSAAFVLHTNSSGEFTTGYQYNFYPYSFIDSGSPALYFPSSAIPSCSNGSNDVTDYCPAKTENFSATMFGTNFASSVISFSVANGDALISSGNSAFDNLGGSISTLSGSFDWGMPFFYGRNVYVALDGASIPGGGTGPYVAFTP